MKRDNIIISLINLFEEYSSMDVFQAFSNIVNDSGRMSEILKQIEELPQLQLLTPQIRESFLRRAESLLKKQWLAINIRPKR